MRDQYQWTAPSPLWAEAADPDAGPDVRAAMKRPALLRFATDTFMEEFLATLEADPTRLGGYLARPEPPAPEGRGRARKSFPAAGETAELHRRFGRRRRATAQALPARAPALLPSRRVPRLPARGPARPRARREPRGARRVRPAPAPPEN